MATALSEFARRFLIDEAALRRELTHPVLLWEAGGAAEADERVLLQTRAGHGAKRPRAGEPLVLPVKKGSSKQNAFAMGITVGRTDSNDIPIDDESVSRFHAWLAEVPQGWKLVDAESKNGTWVGALKLEPNKAEILRDGARIRFGDVEVLFLLPDSLIAWIRNALPKP